MSRDSHLLAIDNLVANAWVIWIHDEVIVVEFCPKFAVEEKHQLEAAVQHLA